MWRAWQLAVFCILYAGIQAQNRSGQRIRQSNRRPPTKSWNSQMYPVWKGTEAQKRDCWKGGQVTFSLQNDAPTLTGAKATFYIQLNFPENQTVLPDGQVVWSQNRTSNGTWAPVFPDETAEGSKCTFPDGSPFPQDAVKRRSKFVYVWQAWGKYWQVVDGPTSNLTVETDGIPLGSYTMDVVVYHYRGRQKFIPIGTISSQFAITDQIPISVSISQVLDLNSEDQRFIQNRAVSFSVTVHDPSHYLQDSDISFSWDFGDQSGTLITRNTAVTHTYVTLGVYKAKVVVQAAIPVTPCGSTVPGAATAQGVATTVLPVEPTTGAAAPLTEGTPVPATSGSQTGAPATTAASGNSTLIDASTEATLNADVVPPEEDVTEAEVPGTVANQEVLPSEVAVLPEAVPSEAEPAVEEAVPSEAAPAVEEAVPSEAAPAVEEAAPAVEEAAPAVEEAVPSEAVPAVEEAVPSETAPAVEEAVPSEAAPAVEEAVPSEAAPAVEEAVPSEAAPAVEEAVPSEMAPAVEEAVPSEAAEEAEAITEAGELIPNVELAQAVTELNEVVAATESEGEVLLLAKRQAPEGEFVGCLLYRYGTYAADLDVVSGIESVQIVQVGPIVSAGMENAVDLTVTCQGSLPRQACTVISGPDCETPQQTVCSPVEPSSDCQLVLRQVFNETGVFCVNVSLADDVSLAVASAQVNVLAGAASSVNGIAITVGILLAVLAMATVAYTYKHVKSYTPLRSDRSSNLLPDRSSVWIFIQNALGRSANGEHSPLLNGRVV